MMRLEWIEDILAVADAGSMIKAADRRFLTQSAFSRRLRMIEENLGVELFDRSRKPAELHIAVLERCDEMRTLAKGLRRLRTDLSRLQNHDHGRIVIASQHAITTALTPLLIQAMTESREIDIRLKSANREDCHALLLTRQADMILFYSTEQQPLNIEPDFIQHFSLGQERLIPVFPDRSSPYLRAAFEQGELPVITYPGDVFLGKVVRDEIWPQLAGLTFKSRAETALTPAALQLAMIGIAVAWVPRSLAQPYLQAGTLDDLSDILGASELVLNAARINGSHPPVAEEVWRNVVTYGPSALRDLLSP